VGKGGGVTFILKGGVSCEGGANLTRKQSTQAWHRVRHSVLEIRDSESQNARDGAEMRVTKAKKKCGK